MTTDVHSDWRSAGWYVSKKACCVCGSTHEIGIEPRFMYPVCQTHSKLSPVEVSRQRIDGKPPLTKNVQ